MKDKILLGFAGRNLEIQNPNSAIYLSKHSWDCKWYWGFGYLGNNSCHWHMEGLIELFRTHDYNITNLLTETFNNQD